MVFAVVDDCGVGIIACLEELAHILCFFRETNVVTTKTSHSKELR